MRAIAVGKRLLRKRRERVMLTGVTERETLRVR